MENYTAVFAATLAEFESPIVNKADADAAKGQLLVRTGYKIWLAGDKHIGYIRKNPGQTQYLKVGVDALMDNRDGSWTDFITDVEVAGQPDKRMVKLAYTPHPAAGSPPYADWVEPNITFPQTPGPMKLKDSGNGGGGGTEPPPSNEWQTEMMAKLDQIIDMQRTLDVKMNALSTQSDENTEKIQTQIHDLVEDMEESLKQVLPIVACRYNAGATQPGGVAGNVAGSIGEFLGGLFRRTRARREQQ